jgi:hypothetical protein
MAPYFAHIQSIHIQKIKNKILNVIKNKRLPVRLPCLASQQDATFLEFISADARHVSGGFSAHHQERVTVHAASVIVNQYCC